eukprot:TRINITY_DN8600_c0_g1_i4.p1 TRINITY_DN8600_c0_g1~~TRINITY_DN8600_c0_g1_i4.p1  ORF type:complete len:410 (+),score=79.90 TRINITY_DN8600_c0_g1_i4:209-1438(+)
MDHEDGEFFPDFTAEAEMERANELFSLGMKYEGTIAIPGWNPDMELGEDEERREYTLTVVMVREEHASRVIYARHAAYGDEQCCNLLLEPPASPGDGVRISYYDCETQCNGTMEVGTGEIRGTVRQLVHGETGFYHPSNVVTHTFELAPCRSMSAAKHLHGAHILACLERARLAAILVQSCADVLPATALQDTNVIDAAVAELLSKIPWREVFQSAASRVEDVCAEMRAQARVMQLLQIEESAHREQELRTKAGVMKRATAHEMADAAIGAVQSVFRAWASFNLINGQEEEHRESVNFGLMIMCKSHERLERAYTALHQAMESAERRLAKDTVQSWVAPGDGSTLCAICMVTLEKDAMAVQLPCSHRFHEECCTQWLHENATCPNCRKVLTDTESQHTPGNAQSGESSP